MGRYTFRLPDIGEGIAEAEIVAWHVKPGDRIEEDGRLADVMTDKATVEMESPVAGIVLEVAGGVGDRVAIGSSLVVIETEGEDTPDLPLSNGADTPPPSASPPPSPPPSPSPSPSAPIASGSPSAVLPSAAIAGTMAGRAAQSKALASPAVRARAIALGIDLATVRPADGAIVRHADLDALLLARVAPPAPTRLPETSAESPPEAPALVISGALEEIRVIGLRRRIAENMAAAKRHIPHFSYVEECDVTELEALRAELNALAAERPRLTMLPLLIRAICACLPDFPMMNARYDDSAGVITRYRSVHMGIATQTDAGLMVPVVRDAQDRDVWNLAAEIRRLAGAARDGTASRDDLVGSTLTITSLGPLGGVATTPVVNRPEVAIIGPNRIIERPMFVPDGTGGERIAKRKLMNVSISCDHRVVDGADAANFVQAVKRLIEAPMRLLAG